MTQPGAGIHDLASGRTHDLPRDGIHDVPWQRSPLTPKTLPHTIDLPHT